MTINKKLLFEGEIQANIEWLHTSQEDDEVQCISIENLQAILERFLGEKFNIKIEE